MTAQIPSSSESIVNKIQSAFSEWNLSKNQVIQILQGHNFNVLILEVYDFQSIVATIRPYIEQRVPRNQAQRQPQVKSYAPQPVRRRPGGRF